MGKWSFSLENLINGNNVYEILICNIGSNGNVTSYSDFSYTYDNRNRLVKVSGNGVNATLEYDYRNRVIARTINGAARYYVYDGWSEIAEYGKDNQMTAKYVNGSRLDEVILTINEKGIFFHHHDALGSETQLTDVNGKVLESYTYSDFGTPTIKDASGKVLASSVYNNRSLFTGRSYWPELGIYDYRNRVYSSELGRFLQTDPMRFDAGDVNIYRYCGNNPVGYVDPWGLTLASTVPLNVTVPQGVTTPYVQVNRNVDNSVSYNLSGSVNYNDGNGDNHSFELIDFSMRQNPHTNNIDYNAVVRETYQHNNQYTKQPQTDHMYYYHEESIAGE